MPVPAATPVFQVRTASWLCQVHLRRDRLGSGEPGLLVSWNRQPRDVIEFRRPRAVEAQSDEPQGLLGLVLPEKAQYRAVRVGNIHDRFARAAVLDWAVLN